MGRAEGGWACFEGSSSPIASFMSNVQREEAAALTSSAERRVGCSSM